MPSLTDLSSFNAITVLQAGMPYKNHSKNVCRHFRGVDFNLLIIFGSFNDKYFLTFPERGSIPEQTHFLCNQI